ncbi:beta-xylosidase [Neptunitalea sp. Y10]|uniref:Beta-xylosidase n=2 Tax=Neptunitalea lumnitzerae TaxID=2965509 RepID=A0ABQ5MKW3_9FLAO|nr:beta-xylosidase [Neptunitalea sp. Y10]
MLWAQQSNLLLADPTIFEYDETYYAYGTKENKSITGEGFLVYTSTDLEHWDGPKGATDGFAFKKGDGYGTTGFWAPQVFKYQDKFFMAYTADEHIAIASSKSPLGPFTNNGSALPSDVRQIDPFVFFDDDKIYLYHVRLDKGNRIFVAELNNNLSAIKPETLTECIYAGKGWEDTEKVEWPVTEGPTVFKRDKNYYLLYSANDFRNKDYAVGYAIATSPFGPWKKSDHSPIISQSLLGYPGTGHGDVFYNTKGDMYYVLHTHFSENNVAPRKTAILKLKLKKQKIFIRSKSLKWLQL